MLLLTPCRLHGLRHNLTLYVLRVQTTVRAVARRKGVPRRRTLSKRDCVSEKPSSRGGDSTTTQSLIPTISPERVTTPDGQSHPSETRDTTTSLQTLQLHRQLSAAQQNEEVGTRVSSLSGSSNVSRERIERRRKKWAVAESEFDAGITERLFPEIRRLPALHELHYGDATMREVDAFTYFARTPWTSCESREATQNTDVTTADAEGEGTPLEDADFVNFDAEQHSVEGAHTTETRAGDLLLGTQLPSGEEAVDSLVAHGVQRPWFVPEGGVVRLEPLSPYDALCLLRFLMRLRQQTCEQLPHHLQQKIKALETNNGDDRTNGSDTIDSRKLLTSLSFEDVMEYLESAPSPVIGFTENLPPKESPGFIFVLYTENVSLQNAIGHMCALLSIPQLAFHTCTAVSKMSCGSVLCAVGPNYVNREHLLLLNTMRHPGFVLRLGSIQEVTDTARSNEMFGELSRWQPLHEVELLLRRISCQNRQEVEHRLNAIKDVGAVFFCSNREASLARAATDVLHGFYKSAVLNALHRRSAPLELRQFIARPNAVTAARARRASTDATVRQTLKSYESVRGDWAQVVARTPYVWRRRWLNALRSAVWNVMASRRLKAEGGGRHVIPGDVVLRPEFRADAQRRMITSVKAEHVMIVGNTQDAARCSMEDVYIPFLRGSFPSDLFAPEDTNHPIMTRTNMLALLRELHAPQLLLGLNDECRRLLDIRSEVSPVLFRRFIIRPISMTFTVLEDKPAVKSVHFDASRLVLNDRLRLQKSFCSNATQPCGSADVAPTGGGGTEGAELIPSPHSLLKQSIILERTTIGARLSSGFLAEEFFTLPERGDYVALGHVERRLHGNFVTAAPQTAESVLSSIDRVFSVYVHAVVRNGVAALAQLLREYFVLSGVEREEDSALQHKVHRMRRELDEETPRLTAPKFCRACYCYCHDVMNTCAEYQHKHGRYMGLKRRQEMLRHLAVSEAEQCAINPMLAGGALDDDGTPMGSGTAAAPVTAVANHGEGSENNQARVYLELLLRRRSEKQKWGVHLTPSLFLSSVDNVGVLANGKLSLDGSNWNSHAVLHQLRSALLEEKDGVSSAARAQLSALRHFIETITSEDETVGSASANASTGQNPGLVPGGISVEMQCVSTSRLQRAFQNPVDPLQIERATAEEESCGSIYDCRWVLTSVNGSAVASRGEVAAIFAQLGKEREIRLTFTSTISARSCDNVGQSVRSDVCSHQPSVLGELPSAMELRLIKNTLSGGSGWGIKIDSDSLAVLNVSELLENGGLAAVRATLDPPLPAGTPLTSVDRKFILRSMDGVPVKTQADVRNHISCRASGRRADSAEEVLCLQLVLMEEKQTTVSTGATILQENVVAPTVVEAARDEISQSGGSHAVEIPVSPGAAPAASKVPSNLVALEPCSPQCTPLTAGQAKSSLLTIVINRSAGAPRERWGIRVQRGTLQLTHIQHNQHFVFDVYAAKQQQAVRVADYLRFSSKRTAERTCMMDSETAAGRRALTYSHFVYIISGVNYRWVRNNMELRTSLAEAARSLSDSVVLHVHQYRLAYIAITVKRQATGKNNSLEPVGLQLSQDMVIESVSAGSAMARGIIAATNDGCSLRNLINRGGLSSGQVASNEGNQRESTTTVISTRTAGDVWQFDLDEDEQLQSSQKTAQDLSTGTETVPIASNAVAAALDQTIAHWNMVDLAMLTKSLHAKEAPAEAGDSAEKTQTQFVWRMLYAVNAGPLHTPQDVVRAFGEDIAEETVYVQQCVVE
ncbi:putative tRNA pseudouridine synthase D (TruD) [Trypanosoma vivax]|nr:putative tRNA pseudouridine synthase D (TruD) [Trypanosoma vivax]